MNLSNLISLKKDCVRYDSAIEACVSTDAHSLYINKELHKCKKYAQRAYFNLLTIYTRQAVNNTESNDIERDTVRSLFLVDCLILNASEKDIQDAVDNACDVLRIF